MVQCVTGITCLQWFMSCRNCQKCKNNTFLLMTFTFLSFKLTYPGISKSFFPFIFRVTLRLVHLIERLFYALWVVGRTEFFCTLKCPKRMSFIAKYSFFLCLLLCPHLPSSQNALNLKREKNVFFIDGKQRALLSFMTFEQLPWSIPTFLKSIFIRKLPWPLGHT